MQQLVSQQALSLKDEYGHLEKDMSIDIFDHPQRVPSVMTVESQTKLLTLLSTLPHGVVKWSHAVPGRSLSLVVVLYSSLFSLFLRITWGHSVQLYHVSQLSRTPGVPETRRNRSLVCMQLCFACCPATICNTARRL